MRLKKHPEYRQLRAFMYIQNHTDKTMADVIGVSERTFHDKRVGYGDFTIEQGDKIAAVLGRSKDEIFVT